MPSAPAVPVESVIPPGEVRRKLKDVLKPAERFCGEVVKALPLSLAEARARRSTVPSLEVLAVAELLRVSPAVELKFGSTIGCAADSRKRERAKAKARSLGRKTA
jgi:hypothetical protein